MLLFQDPGLLEMLAHGAPGFVPVGPPNVQIGLFTGTPLLNRFTVLADLTEPTFPGYARVNALGSGGPYIDPLTSSAMQDCLPAVFIASAAPVAGQLITGYFLTDPTGLILWAVDVLPNPILIAHAGEGLTKDVVLSFPPVT
jgi:hypothetical protein